MNWKLKTVKLSDIKEYEANPRKITEKGLSDLKKSIKNFGQAEPLVVDKDITLIGGHARKLAMESLGYETCEVYISEKKLTDKQFQELNVRLNKNIAGEFDFEKLENFFEIGDLLDWGFEDWEFETDIENKEVKEDNYEITEEIETDIVVGDLIEIGNHRLLCGDSTDIDNIDKLLNNNKVDLIFTDPPYEIEGKEIYSNFNIHNNCNVLIFASDKQVPFIFESNIGEFKRAYVLDTGIASPTNNDVYVNHILLLRFKIGDSIKFNNIHNGGRSIVKTDYRKNIKDDRTTHKHQKSLTTLGLFIQYWSNENSIIFDGFLGSGSTMVSCHQLKRICYGIELEPKYCQVIIDRMLKLDNSLEIKINGKKYENKRCTTT